MDYKWIGLEQKWIGSRKLDFLLTPSCVNTICDEICIVVMLFVIEIWKMNGYMCDKMIWFSIN